jgi:hypothetical protein
MPAKVVSLKMPNLPSVEVRDRIELSSRALRECGVEFHMKCRELETLCTSAVDDLRKSYADQVDAINSEGGS